MTDSVAYELHNLIKQNQEMERRLRELQAAIATIRADFETVVAARIKDLDTLAVRENHAPSARQMASV